MLELNKVYQGDCIVLIKQLPTNSVDFSFTSPPYNRKRNDKYMYYNDSIQDYFQFLVDITDQMLRVSNKNVFVNIMKNYYNKSAVYKYIGHYSAIIDDIFIWEKSNPLPANGANITNAYEFIICFRDLKSYNTYTKNHITTSVTKMPIEHKAVMNIEVADFFINNFTKKNDIILDPFIGSGTTAIAAIKTGRNFIGFEIAQEYCDMSNNRIQEALAYKSKNALELI